jgi:hypothetical protein
MRSLKLYFEMGQLTEVTFRENANGEARRSIRGKTGGAFRSAGSFQWTSAVRALGLLLAQTAANSQSSTIQGHAGSLAASLDYALSKQPVWVAEMFGCDQQGISYARRLFLRTNPERKRPGPVVLGVNHVYLPPSAIEVYIEGALCTGSALEELVATLLDQPYVPPMVSGEAQMKMAANQ